jgi:hypothetical protein
MLVEAAECGLRPGESFVGVGAVDDRCGRTKCGVSWRNRGRKDGLSRVLKEE